MNARMTDHDFLAMINIYKERHENVAYLNDADVDRFYKLIFFMNDNKFFDDDNALQDQFSAAIKAHPDLRAKEFIEVRAEFYNIFEKNSDLEIFMMNLSKLPTYVAPDEKEALIQLAKTYISSSRNDNPHKVLIRFNEYMENSLKENQPAKRLRRLDTCIQQLEKYLYGRKPINPKLAAAIGGVVATLIIAAICIALTALIILSAGAAATLPLAFAAVFASITLPKLALGALSLGVGSMLGMGIFKACSEERKRYDHKVLELQKDSVVNQIGVIKDVTHRRHAV